MQERIKNCVSQVIEESVGTRGEGVYLIDIKVKGKGSLTFCEPSRFIDEIDSEYVEYIGKPNSFGSPWGSSQKTKPEVKLTGQAINSFTPREKLKKLNTILSNSAAPSEENTDIESLQVGMEVEHLRFGKGKVLQMEGSGPNKKATVFFNSVGQKQLLLKFAKLKILS